VARYRVSSRQHGSVEVDATNWLVALGDAAARLGVVGGMDRIACEGLPNGQFLVRDVRSGLGFVICPLDEEDDSDAPTVQGPLPIAAGDGQPSDAARKAGALVRRAAPGQAAAVALTEAMRLVPADAGAVLFRDGFALRFSVAVGAHAARIQGTTIPRDAGIAGWCVARRTSAVVRSAPEDPRFFRGIDARTGFQTRSVLCVPVTRDGDAIGCLELVNAPGGAFADGQLVDAELVAAALGETLGATSGETPSGAA
jgi:GAF domain-containing protein